MAKVRFSGGAPVLVRSLNAQIDGLSSNTVNSIVQWGPDIRLRCQPRRGHHPQRLRGRTLSSSATGSPTTTSETCWPTATSRGSRPTAGVAMLDRLGLIRRPTGAPTIANVLGTDGTTIWVGTSDGVWRFDPSESSWTDVGPDTRQIYVAHVGRHPMWAGSTRNLLPLHGHGADVGSVCDRRHHGRLPVPGRWRHQPNPRVGRGGERRRVPRQRAAVRSARRQPHSLRRDQYGQPLRQCARRQRHQASVDGRRRVVVVHVLEHVRGQADDVGGVGQLQRGYFRYRDSQLAIQQPRTPS